MNLCEHFYMTENIVEGVFDGENKSGSQVFFLPSITVFCPGNKTGDSVKHFIRYLNRITLVILK